MHHGSDGDLHSDADSAMHSLPSRTRFLNSLSHGPAAAAVVESITAARQKQLLGSFVVVWWDPAGPLFSSGMQHPPQAKPLCSCTGRAAPRFDSLYSFRNPRKQRCQLSSCSCGILQWQLDIQAPEAASAVACAKGHSKEAKDAANPCLVRSKTLLGAVS
jgi:hypothetical protein